MTNDLIGGAMNPQSMFAVIILIVAGSAMAQTTQPSTQPSEQILPAEQLLSQMLRPTGPSAARPLQPLSDAPSIDATSGAAAVAPAAASMLVLREGSFIVDRTGRLSRGADGQSWEFTFDSDARAMKDPPLVILPNLKLMAMENAIKGSSRDLRFRVTGMLTEYGGRNFILLEKVVVVSDISQKFD